MIFSRICGGISGWWDDGLRELIMMPPGTGGMGGPLQPMGNSTLHSALCTRLARSLGIGEVGERREGRTCCVIQPAVAIGLRERYMSSGVGEVDREGEGDGGGRRLASELLCVVVVRGLGIRTVAERIGRR